MAQPQRQHRRCRQRQGQTQLAEADADQRASGRTHRRHAAQQRPGRPDRRHIQADQHQDHHRLELDPTGREQVGHQRERGRQQRQRHAALPAPAQPLQPLARRTGRPRLAQRAVTERAGHQTGQRQHRAQQHRTALLQRAQPDGADHLRQGQHQQHLRRPLEGIGEGRILEPAPHRAALGPSILRRRLPPLARTNDDTPSDLPLRHAGPVAALSGTG